MSQELKVVLIYATPEGSREVKVEEGELRIGRGEVDLRFADASMSRHHATVFRQGERIWVLDENSTNGTFVNGAEVAPNGTILQNGDVIRVGNEMTLTLKIEKASKAATKQTTNINQTTVTASQSAPSPSSFLPLAVVAVAVAVIGLAIVAVAARAIIFAEPEQIIAQSNRDDFPSEDPNEEDEPKNTNQKESKPTASPTINNTNSVNTNASEPTNTPPPKQLPVAPTKTYLAMSDAEKRQFIESKAKIISGMIGNGNTDDAVPPEAVERIKVYVDAYANRLKRPKLSGACNFTKDNLETLIERASQNANFIVPAFNSEGIAPQVGLYLAMIESEHCVCLQSPTGPLGMFQFARATAESFGLKVFKGATKDNPDERCTPEKAAPAAARYMKFLMGRYGTGASSVPLAIASYNSGEGGLSRNLETALKQAQDKERSFWTLLLMVDKLSAQFQKENKKYVPLFFAAAIVGENPTVFGVNKPPISSNTQ
jgi:hypothetical protein